VKAVKTVRKARPKKAAAKKAAAKKAARAPKKAAPSAAPSAAKSTVLDSVLDVISKAKNGVDIKTLKAKTKLEARQLSNALYKLTKKGVIEARSRGIYFKK
jgi:predicted Rossmann fold nucleotide-binding protein DprA/Smf involved in DNA uptake